MPRPLRTLKHAATALSALLCAATVALWVRSDQGWDVLRYDTPLRTSALHSRGAQLAFTSMRHLTPSPSPNESSGGFKLEHWPVTASLTGNPSGFAGFVNSPVDAKDGKGLFTLCVVPHWALVLAFATAPAATSLRLARRRRRRRKPPGHCPTCGYDLRATPTRCPECGTPAAR
jgi:hypothetical protein